MHVCAEDHMQHTVCSRPYSFLVDLTLPLCTPPTDMVLGLRAPAIFSSRAGFAATWECNDPESGVASTSWMAYTQLLKGGYAAPLLTRKVRMLGGPGRRSVTVRSLMSTLQPFA